MLGITKLGKPVICCTILDMDSVLMEIAHNYSDPGSLVMYFVYFKKVHCSIICIILI